MNEHLVDPKAARVAAFKARREFAQTGIGKKAKALWGALTEYFHFRESGVSREDAALGLIPFLRELFPVSKFGQHECAGCDGTGWRITACTYAARCGRRSCTRYEDSFEHPYAVPCECPHGDRHRKRIVQIDDELAAVGRTKKRTARPFSRMGS